MKKQLLVSLVLATLVSCPQLVGMEVKNQKLDGLLWQEQLFCWLGWCADCLDLESCCRKTYKKHRYAKLLQENKTSDIKNLKKIAQKLQEILDTAILKKTHPTQFAKKYTDDIVQLVKNYKEFLLIKEVLSEEKMQDQLNISDIINEIEKTLQQLVVSRGCSNLLLSLGISL